MLMPILSIGATEPPTHTHTHIIVDNIELVIEPVIELVCIMSSLVAKMMGKRPEGDY